ncbi:MAG: TVP38/TMEM64 family protein [Candidatus Omnitrophica bacterium]|nr:TVP38/TMEM64 family protein [Candidatus Omnitrophota bacterium]
MSKGNLQPWIKVILLVALLGGVFTALRLRGVDFSGIEREDFRAWVVSLGGWGPVGYIVIYVLRPLILFPAGVLSAAAGVIWGAWLGFLYLQIAANISAATEFFIARYFARDTVAKYLKGRAQGLDRRIETHGFLTVLLVRLIPNVAWDIQNLSLGLTKVRFRDYFLATLIGIMPGSFALVFFGASLIKVLYNPRNAWILGIALVVFAAVYGMKRVLRARHDRPRVPKNVHPR